MFLNSHTCAEKVCRDQRRQAPLLKINTQDYYYFFPPKDSTKFHQIIIRSLDIRIDLPFLYSRRQKKVHTSLNCRKIKSNKDRNNLKTGNKARIHQNYVGVHCMMVRLLLQFSQQFIANNLKIKSCTGCFYMFLHI